MKQDSKTIIDVNKDPGLHHRPIEFKPAKLPMIIPMFYWGRDKR